MWRTSEKWNNVNNERQMAHYVREIYSRVKLTAVYVNHFQSGQVERSTQKIIHNTTMKRRRLN